MTKYKYIEIEHKEGFLLLDINSIVAIDYWKDNNPPDNVEKHMSDVLTIHSTMGEFELCPKTNPMEIYKKLKEIIRNGNLNE